MVQAYNKKREPGHMSTHKQTPNENIVRIGYIAECGSTITNEEIFQLSDEKIIHYYKRGIREQKKDRANTVLSIVFWLFIAAGFIGLTWANGTHEKQVSKIIPCGAPVTVDDYNLNAGEVKALNECIEGRAVEVRKYSNWDDSDKGLVSTTVITEATAKKTAIGRKIVVPSPVYTPASHYNEGHGAICNDGWRSYSQGRGTCSWHGGVNYYF